ncbi:hypothetical protein BYT27DRAFT_7240092 [Phlegmacium glaucopus]|nr:hypothetical protein BYT27DRAFT_7240092 [Phlegmacium glaucopus]
MADADMRHRTTQPQLCKQEFDGKTIEFDGSVFLVVLDQSFWLIFIVKRGSGHPGKGADMTVSVTLSCTSKIDTGENSQRFGIITDKNVKNWYRIWPGDWQDLYEVQMPLSSIIAAVNYQWRSQQFSEVF